MYIMWFLGFLIVLLTLRKDPQALRFKVRPFLKFLVFLCFVTAVRLSLFYAFESQWGYEREVFRSMLYLIDPYDLLMVWWEDVFFVLPLLLMSRRKATKHGIAVLGLILSSIFALGHLYQGVTFALITLLYVPVTFYYAKKHGLGTTAACHVAYDMATFSFLYLLVNLM